MIISIICGCIVFIALIILIIKLKSDKLYVYDIKIKEAEKEIQTLLEKKMSLLSEIHQKLSEQIEETNFNYLCNLDEIGDDEFKLNSILNNAYSELKDFLENRRSFIPEDDTKVLIDELYRINIECIATKNYYNDNTIILNSKIKKFPSNIIAKFKHLYKRELYNDPIEEEFEILKKK